MRNITAEDYDTLKNCSGPCDDAEADANDVADYFRLCAAGLLRFEPLDADWVAPVTTARGRIAVSAYEAVESLEETERRFA